MTKTEIKTIKKEIEKISARSAWRRGVKAYALNMVYDLGLCDYEIISNVYMLKDAILNGAHDFKEYSYSGLALIFDSDIAMCLCNDSELRRTRNGERRPNASENWLDVQARALYQAWGLVKQAYMSLHV